MATGGKLKLEEGTGGGDHVGFKAPDTEVDAEVIWTLPDTDGATGQVMATDGTKTLDWITPALSSELGAEETARSLADTTLQNNIDTEITARTNADNAEITARSNADTTLQNNIDAEETARSLADTTLQNNIDTEITARNNADTTLQNSIDVEITARTNADNAEITARNNADITLQNSINSLINTGTVNIANANYTRTNCSGTWDLSCAYSEVGDSVTISFTGIISSATAAWSFSFDDSYINSVLNTSLRTRCCYNTGVLRASFTNVSDGVLYDGGIYVSNTGLVTLNCTTVQSGIYTWTATFSTL